MKVRNASFIDLAMTLVLVQLVESSQMKKESSVPIERAVVSEEAAHATQGNDQLRITLVNRAPIAPPSDSQILLNGEPADYDAAVAAANGRDVLLDVQRTPETQLMADLYGAGANVSMRVDKAERNSRKGEDHVRNK